MDREELRENMKKFGFQIITGDIAFNDDELDKAIDLCEMELLKRIKSEHLLTQTSQ